MITVHVKLIDKHENRRRFCFMQKYVS